jgi:hypothetical protein
MCRELLNGCFFIEFDVEEIYWNVLIFKFWLKSGISEHFIHEDLHTFLRSSAA